MADIRVGIFDDHPLTSRGLEHYLGRNDIKVLFNSTTKEDLFEKTGKEKPDILVLDVLAPDVLGLEMFEEVVSSYPEIKVVAYTSLSSPLLVENLLALGVLGYVNKKQAPEDILECIGMVFKNSIYVPREYSFLTSRFRVFNNHNLTHREVEILRLIANELTSVQIANQLSISVNTVENHRKTIFRKLEVKNLAGMIVAATRLGYIS